MSGLLCKLGGESVVYYGRQLSYSAPTALAALILPPVTTFPFNAGSVSTDLKSCLRKSATDMLEFFESTKAATPATIGVAIDVPDASRKSLSSHVLRISLPGAAMCTLFNP